MVNHIIDEMSQINEIVNHNQGTKDGQMVRNITQVVRNIRRLKYSDLKELFTEVAEQSGYETDKIKSLKRYGDNFLENMFCFCKISPNYIYATVVIIPCNKRWIKRVLSTYRKIGLSLHYILFNNSIY